MHFWPVAACRDPTKGGLSALREGELVIGAWLSRQASARIAKLLETLRLIEACLGEPSSYRSVSQPYERVICLIEACLESQAPIAAFRNPTRG